MVCDVSFSTHVNPAATTYKVGFYCFWRRSVEGAELQRDDHRPRLLFYQVLFQSFSYVIPKLIAAVYIDILAFCLFLLCRRKWVFHRKIGSSERKNRHVPTEDQVPLRPQQLMVPQWAVTQGAIHFCFGDVLVPCSKYSCFVTHIVTTFSFFIQNPIYHSSDWAMILRPSPRRSPRREMGWLKWIWQPLLIFTHFIQPPKMIRRNQLTPTSPVGFSLHVPLIWVLWR